MMLDSTNEMKMKKNVSKKTDEAKELRLLELLNPAYEKVEVAEKEVNGKSCKYLYKDYLPIQHGNSLKEIIFGPKSIERSDAEFYKKQLLKEHLNVEVRISKAPLS